MTMIAMTMPRALCAFVLVALFATPAVAIADEVPNDQALLENLTLLQGRLQTARELIRLGQSDIALKRHLGDNLNGRVGGIEPELQARKLPGFDNELKGLVAAAGSVESYDAALAKVTPLLAKIESSIPAPKLASPKFLASVLSNVVAHAAVDYRAGVKDGKVAIIKEYEEIFGYDRAAVALWKARLEPALGGKSPAFADAFAKLAAAVPSPVPPDKIELTPDGFEAISATIKVEAEKLK
jgi:hypothetical protein